MTAHAWRTVTFEGDPIGVSKLVAATTCGYDAGITSDGPMVQPGRYLHVDDVAEIVHKMAANLDAAGRRAANDLLVRLQAGAASTPT